MTTSAGLGLGFAAVGPLMGEIGASMRRHRQRLQSGGGGGLRGDGRGAVVRLFSGHDSSIFPLFHVLGMRHAKERGFWPPFTSNVRLDLLRRRKEGGGGGGGGGGGQGPRFAKAENSVSNKRAGGKPGSGLLVRAVFNGEVQPIGGPCQGRELCPLEEFLSICSDAEAATRATCNGGGGGGGGGSGTMKMTTESNNNRTSKNLKKKEGGDVGYSA